MKFLDEFRDPALAHSIAEKIKKITTRPWALMEVCGGQTHSFLRFGIDKLLPSEIELIHGPGCPVCVTPVEVLDKAIAIAEKPEVIFCTFGDMLRVPGSQGDLYHAKAGGADVRIVYSPLDALTLARDNPQREVVFFAVGFETTAPANAMLVYQAFNKGIKNLSVLVSHVLVPPAIEHLMAGHNSRVQGFLAAGHVCTVMGFEEYIPLSKKYKVPIVVTGFEPVDLLEGIYLCVKQLEEGRAEVENQYARSVLREGNKKALDLIAEVFENVDRLWRGIGKIEKSGFALNKKYRALDAEVRFDIRERPKTSADERCVSGLIMQGLKKPNECPHFGVECTPESPLGATMVSNEGACSAYYRYRRFSGEAQ